MSDRILARTFHNMMSIFNPHQESFYQHFESPLTNAARWVLQSQKIGLPIFTLEQTQKLDVFSHLLLIANRLDLNVRKVSLGSDWESLDIGPMILFDKISKTPVALTSRQKYGRFQYYVCEATATAKPIPLQDATRYEDHGYIFQRRFPSQSKISLFKVGKLISKTGLKDIRTTLSTQSAITLLGFMTPIFTGYLFGTVIPNADQPMLIQMVFLMVLNVILLGILYLTQAMSLFRIQLKLVNMLQIAVWHRLFHLPVSFFRKFKVGDLAMRADSINAAHSLVGTFEITTFLTGIFSFLTFGLLFHYSPYLSIVALLLTCVISLINILLLYFQVQLEAKMIRVSHQITALLREIFLGIAKIRVASAERRAFNLWGEKQVDRFNIHIKKTKYANLLLVINTFLHGLSVMAIYAYAYLQVGTEFHLGDFVSFNTAYLSFSASFLAMLNGLERFWSIVPQLKRLKPILETLPEKTTTGKKISKLQGNITIDNVSFRYDESTPMILQAFSCQIKAGQFVAIVGPSGAGKSTLLRLLLGFEAPLSGEIFYDQYPLHTLALNSLRNHLGVVLQNDALIPGSIMSNILGFGAGTEEQAMLAAQKAAIDQDIFKMPMGLQTYIMEGAHTLSGGQRQRILLARALAKSPRILFLDEATSALDNKTQHAISKNLNALQMTRVVIAHRLSTIQHADTILVLNEGRLSQQGNFTELSSVPGLFRDLIQRQLS